MDVVLVVLIMALILGVPIALMVWAVVRAIRHSPRRVDALLALSADSDGSTADLMSRLAEPMDRWGYRLHSQGYTGILFSRTYRPVWLVFPCVLLFPLGLLSLLYSRTVDVVFSAPRAGERFVAVSGAAPTRLLDEIGAALSEGARQLRA